MLFILEIVICYVLPVPKGTYYAYQVPGYGRGVNFGREPTFDDGHFCQVKFLPDIAIFEGRPRSGAKKWVDLSQKSKLEKPMEPKHLWELFEISDLS